MTALAARRRSSQNELPGVHIQWHAAAAALHGLPVTRRDVTVANGAVADAGSEGPATWSAEALPSLRQLALLTLLAVLLSLGWGMLRDQGLHGSGSGGGGRNGEIPGFGTLTPQLRKLLSGIDMDLAPWEEDGVHLEQVEGSTGS